MTYAGYSLCCARTLGRNPGFSLAAVLVLALGIGANTAIFTVVRAVLLAPLPYRDPDRLVRLYERNVVGETNFNIVSAPNFLDWQRDAKSFEQMADWAEWTPSLAAEDGALPENLTGTICSANLFSVLGVQPALGRAFLPEDDSADAPANRDPERRVLAPALRRRSARNRQNDSTGRTCPDDCRSDARRLRFSRFRNADLASNLAEHLPANAKQQRGNHRFSVVARLNPGVSVEQARTEVDNLAQRIRQQNPTTLTGAGANAAALAERTVARVRPLLITLLGAVACVLLIACVNVANLLLVRAVSRKREIAIRAALGASRFQLAKGFVWESVLLSSAGAVCGLMLAAFGTDILIKMAGAIPRIESVRVNGTVCLWFTAVVAVFHGNTPVGFLVPAFSALQSGLAQPMQEGGRSSTAGRSRGFVSRCPGSGRSGAVADAADRRRADAEKLRQAPLRRSGFSRRSRAGHAIHRAAAESPGAAGGQFLETLLAKVTTMPGVESAALVSWPPLSGQWSDTTFTIEGPPPLAPGQRFLDALIRAADPGYFHALAIPLKRGRVFTTTERLDAATKNA